MPEIIPWAAVPEGHFVWFSPHRWPDMPWRHGRKRDGLLFNSDGVPSWELNEFVFARAEQGPGAHAAELAEADRTRIAEVEHWVTRYKELNDWRISTAQLHQKAEADLTRLRAGLAALEQRWREVRLLGTENLLDELAALREGR